MLHADMFANYGTQKRCACCHKVKELWQFNRCGDGYQSYCRECQRMYRRRFPCNQYKKNRKDDYSMDIFNGR